MKVEAELSDKEWRQMRRQMPKLEFEPVPETPALLPRSVYGESDKELNLIEAQDEQVEETRESSHLEGDESSNHHDSPTYRSSIFTNPDKPKKLNRELPSTSMAVSPLITTRYRPREQKHIPDGNIDVDDAEIAALGVQMATALEAARRSAIGGFMELRTKQARSEALERAKLTNDVAILQNQVKELQDKLVFADVQQEKRELLLDRFSEFAVKQSSHNDIRWCGERSLASTFHAWKTVAQHTVIKHRALRHVLTHACKRQQLASFRSWKDNVQGFLYQKQLQDQRDRYEHRIVEVAKEYQLKIQQLQQVIDNAKSQVAESLKCRQKLEEDLRLIFLRGVSAMNIEALTIFGSNHKQTLKQREQDRLTPRTQTVVPPGSIPTQPSAEIVCSQVAPPPPPPKHSTPTVSLESSPIAVEGPSTAYSTPAHARVSVVRPSCSQMPSYSSRGMDTWSRVSTSPALRSAEMVRQHEISPSVGHRYRPSSAPSPTKKRSVSRSSTKHQVEMQYMRSTVAASAARAGGGSFSRPLLSTRSPSSSAKSRRS